MRVAPSSANAKVGGIDVASFVDSNGVRVPSVSLTITDASRFQASDYELVADPAGSGDYFLTRLRDGFTQTVASGDVVDGFRIDIVGPLPVANDKFLLQPVGTAASRMQRALADPRGIAAAAPVTANLGAANAGTMSVASLRAVNSSLDPALTAILTFTSATGNYDWELRDASNAVVSNGSATWQAGVPIPLNGWELQLAGVPASGDSLTVQKTLFPASNNGNARALVDLRGAALVGASAQAGGATLTDAYANAMTDVAARVQGARSSAQMSASASGAAKTANDDVSGVNLDEEAARLIQYQQSYQAAAKLLQVAQTVFDALLATGRLGAIAAWLVSLPVGLVSQVAQAATASGDEGLIAVLRRPPTAIDNMNPQNPGLQVLESIPVASRIQAHSIIAVDSDKPLDVAGDGVVKYESAHITGVASELVVHSPHSGMQDAAQTVEEVRRIFLEHSANSACPKIPD